MVSETRPLFRRGRSRGRGHGRSEEEVRNTRRRLARVIDPRRGGQRGKVEDGEETPSLTSTTTTPTTSPTPLFSTPAYTTTKQERHVYMMLNQTKCYISADIRRAKDTRPHYQVSHDIYSRTTDETKAKDTAKKWQSPTCRAWKRSRRHGVWDKFKQNHEFVLQGYKHISDADF